MSRATSDQFVLIWYPHIEEYGGIERNIVALAEKIVAKGLRPLLLCFYDKVGMERFAPDLAIQILAAGANPLFKAWKLRAWLNHNRKRLVGRPLFFGAKAGFYAGILPMGDFVLHYTDPPSLWSGNTVVRRSPRSRLANQIYALGTRRSSRLLTMTGANALELEQLYRRKAEVIYQGGMPPTLPIDRRRRCQGPVLRLFSVCRLADSKNLSWIFQAAKAVESSSAELGFQRVEIEIAGRGPALETLQEEARKLVGHVSVSFSGFRTVAEIEESYRIADLVMVSARQGYGLPVLEALYRAVPVIVNQASRVAEILENNPWVCITNDTIESFSERTVAYLKSIRTDYPCDEDIERLPTESQWAEQIGVRCDWWNGSVALP